MGKHVRYVCNICVLCGCVFCGVMACVFSVNVVCRFCVGLASMFCVRVCFSVLCEDIGVCWYS